MAATSGDHGFGSRWEIYLMKLAGVGVSFISGLL